MPPTPIEAARVWAAESPRRAVVVTGSITLVGEAIALAARRGLEVSDGARRRRGPASAPRAQLTETLLSIVLVLEAIMLFFAALTVVRARHALDPGWIALVGGGVLIVVLAAASGVLR